MNILKNAYMMIANQTSNLTYDNTAFLKANFAYAQIHCVTKGNDVKLFPEFLCK